jgi:hypothetical protein
VVVPVVNTKEDAADENADSTALGNLEARGPCTSDILLQRRPLAK